MLLQCICQEKVIRLLPHIFAFSARAGRPGVAMRPPSPVVRPLSPRKSKGKKKARYSSPKSHVTSTAPGSITPREASPT